MHLNAITLHTDRFPADDIYPFSVPALRNTRELPLDMPVTFLIGENGTGKSTLLEAIARGCGIYIWRDRTWLPLANNPHAEELHRYLEVTWTADPVPGTFFASETFRHFAELLDEWAKATPGILSYFGGASLLAQSHGQCNMAFFENRFKIRGLYLLDEPESALSPRRQIELLRVIRAAADAGHAQFVIVTHSPILLALPGARIFSLDGARIAATAYEDTEYFTLYRDFLNSRGNYL